MGDVEDIGSSVALPQDVVYTERNGAIGRAREIEMQAREAELIENTEAVEGETEGLDIEDLRDTLGLGNNIDVTA